MSKITVAALVLTLLLLGFSAALFAFSLPVWMPIVLIVLSVTLLALMAYKTSKKTSKRRYSAPTGAMHTPHAHGVMSWELGTPPPTPRRT